MDKMPLPKPTSPLLSINEDMESPSVSVTPFIIAGLLLNVLGVLLFLEMRGLFLILAGIFTLIGILMLVAGCVLFILNSLAQDIENQYY